MFHLSRALRSLSLVTPVLCGAWPLLGQSIVHEASTLPTPPRTARVDRDFGQIPLSFEPSGEGDSSFLARGNGYSVQLNSDGALLQLGSEDVVRMKLDRANAVRPSATNLLPGTVNYFIGNDPRRWRTNLPTYARVSYSGVYPGVDLVYYGNRRALEYDLVISPRASVKPIRLRFDGAQLSLEKNGDLQIKGAHGVIAFHQPVAYQTVGSVKRPVRARFVKTSSTEVAFAVGRYNRNQALVIDPQIAYSTYFSGTMVNRAAVKAIAVDSSGSAYITGSANRTLPVTPGAFQTTDPEQSPDPKFDPQSAAFVSKLSPDGSSLVYSTYIGGTHEDIGTAIAVDSGGNAYLTGTTRSPDFPVTAGVFQPTNKDPFGYTTGFLIKLNPSGSGLVYATYLGGSGHPGSPGGEEPAGVAVGASGDAFVTGLTYSSDFPVTPGAVQTMNKALGNREANIFVTRFNPAATALIYSTYIGGSGLADEQYRPGYLGDHAGYSLYGITLIGDLPRGIALDSAGNAYIVGSSLSLDFPTTPGAFQSVNRTSLPSRLSPAPEPVVCKLNPTGTALIYSTYLGGSGTVLDSGAWLQPRGSTVPSPLIGIYYDYLNAIAVDKAGNAYVAGISGSSDYPVTAGALQPTNREITGNNDYWTAVLTELNSAGTGILYSTYFGGSTDTRRNAAGTYLNLQSFVDTEGAYGVALDSKGNVYLAGITHDSDFPVTSGAVDKTLTALRFNGVQSPNVYLAVINPAASQLVYATYLGGHA